VGRCQDDVGRDEAPGMDGDLRSLAEQADRRRRHPDGDPSSDERGRHRVVRAEHPDKGVDAGPGLEMEVGVRQRIRESPEEPAFDEEALGDRPAEASDVAVIRDVVRPGVVLTLHVLERAEVAERQEARLGIADRALDIALRGRSGRTRDDGLGAQRAEQTCDLVVEPGPRSCTRRDDRGVIVEDELLGHPTEPGQAADQTRAQVADRARQAEGHGVGGRERQGHDQTEGLPADASPDRHPDTGMPPVDLADLARLVRRALERPAGQERRTDVAQVVLEDRDPAPVPEWLQAFADDRRPDPRTGGQHRRDPLGERVEL
jgi:hypothetical protein